MIFLKKLFVLWTEMLSLCLGINAQGDFVAVFGQSNEGDVSPNTRGAKCIDTGLPCEANHSTCHGKVSPICAWECECIRVRVRCTGVCLEVYAHALAYGQLTDVCV